METNLAYDDSYETVYDELIDGRFVAMSPSPSSKHNIVAENLYSIFRDFLRGKPCRPCSDKWDVFLTKKDRFVPDMSVICDKSKIRANGIHGTPDLVIEVLSPSTAKRDRGYKKNVYEACGVREYWIVNPADLSVEQYLLEDGKFVLHDLLSVYPDHMLEKMSDEEKARIPSQFSCGIFPELIVSLDEIFSGIL